MELARYPVFCPTCGASTGYVSSVWGQERTFRCASCHLPCPALDLATGELVRGLTVPLHPQAVHTCHAQGCKAPVAEKLLMCARHWAMVPPVLKRAVYGAYVPGQEERKDPTPAYILAARAAVKAVAEYEERAKAAPTPTPGMGGQLARSRGKGGQADAVQKTLIPA